MTDTMPTALVTGASRGLGRALALELARQGAHVIAVAKGKKGLEALDDEIRALGFEATLVPLDLKKWDGIDELGLAIHERWKKLDILVGSAGSLGPLTPLSHVKPKDWQDVIDINMTANYRLIRSMDPLLRASDAGRVCFITSGVTTRLRGYWGPYMASKAALEALALTYAKETEKTPIRVNLVDPGVVATAMRKEAYPGEDQSALNTPEATASLIVKVLAPGFTQTGQRFDLEGLKD